MSDLLITGSNAVRNSQLALNVVSNNIANVNTEGYVKQSINYAETPSAVVGAISIGTGAIADGISRAYDGLIENAVRTSESDLVSKEAMLEHTNRLIDFLGDEKASLTPALGNFFDSLRSLATDASSVVQRDQVIASGKSLANRFNEISSQLEAFNEESSSELELKVSQANELMSELALVNKKLIRIQDLAKQPPELLNLRDRLLKDLSSFIKTAVLEKENGSFEVSTRSGGELLVDKNGFAPLSLHPSEADKNKLEIFQSSASGEFRLNRPGGNLEGLLDFRDRILTPVSEGLEEVAATFMARVNTVHSSGVDMLGNIGKQLFSADSSIEVKYPDLSGRLAVSVKAQPNSVNLQPSYEIQFDSDNKVWKSRNSNGDLVLAHADAQTILLDDLALEIKGNAKDGDIIVIATETDTAGSIRFAIEDHRLLAAAGSHSLVAASSNVGDSSVVLSVDKKALPGLLPTLTNSLANNIGSDSAQVFSNSSIDAAFVVEAGSRDTRLRFQGLIGDDSELQVFTRGGVHLFGRKLEAAEFENFVQGEDAFYDDVNYRSNLLNGGSTEIRVDIKDLSTTDGGLTINGQVISQGFPVPSAMEIVDLVNASTEVTEVVASIEQDKTLVIKNAVGKESNEIDFGADLGVLGQVQGLQGPQQYLDLGWRAGVFGKSSFAVDGDGRRYLRQEASISGNSIPQISNDGLEDLDVISAGSLSLNGKALGALTLEAGEVLTPIAVQEWMTANIEELELTLSANLVTTVAIEAKDLSTTSGELEINGVIIGREEPFEDLEELERVINESTDQTGVLALSKSDGTLVLQNSNFENRDQAITLGASSASIPDAIGIKRPALNISFERLDDDLADHEVKLALGQNGGFSDLAVLGLSGTVELDGVASEELIVFSSGRNGASSKISAEYSKETDEGSLLINRGLTLEFLAEDQYRFIDNVSGTILTERSYESGGNIEFQGLVLDFSGNPQKGDMFTIAPQESGQGDTSTLLQLSSLEKATIFQDSKSLQDGYLSVLSKVGALSNQADVAREAYAVLRDQAEERREGLSGVNLDEEAGSLIRFQQSYQASARLVRTANEIFDTILRI